MNVSLNDAERMVEEQLRDLEQRFEPKDLAIDREHIKEYEWGWLIPWAGRCWVERREDAGVILALAPFSSIGNRVRWK